ncbi:MULTISPECIES: TonB-dependent receptor [unclassified Leeuwenhoekiella]|uniref:SusC/RagA family TonB-linked outer membrane protein n=1 Tax=unclassified Leeuwenhoekiella TaxID=2615029 RepID=UPI000C4AEF42|nr:MULTISPECIES: TonB-dependent receptor [unclassified Leeuwenhoekiella]MAW94471.1 SusC/RagA family TonB-linked outer membrane protein [Leeuwenhoekiella sp.]MAW96967.1 SusC/RagA family TonB-linked outer membrane protein [Leeuwenhoekiella sp.]MBA81149.1 SusC/RagA family TonB-linked outer membrane protein [Leeuwenhoekiella sp.]|tara:strand:+ start:21331 stop:24327 length:2997 start_codon:yes stop_codon:yes gene_type:complete
MSKMLFYLFPINYVRYEKRKLVLLSFFLMATLCSFSQKSITGTVTDDKGMPLPGVTVKEQNTSNGAVTDFDGNFNLTITQTDAVLIFSFVGFETQEVPVGNQTNITVSLKENLESLSEVVVIGYGTQKRADVTSAVASVKSDEFIEGNVRDAAQLVQGKVAGLSISAPSGDPTAGTQIRLRGIATLNGSSAPLILVDGVPGSLQTVAPEDIASIDVLKDGSATAIYGTRGTNGVIIITTKGAGNNMQPTIEYTGNVSFQSISNKLDFLNASELRDKYDEGYSFTGANLQDYGSDTDWLDEITQNSISTIHNVLFRGGNENTNLSASVNYRNLQGIFINTNNKRYTGRIDVNHAMFDGKLKTNFNVIVSEQEFYTGGDGYSFNPYVFRQALIRNPTEPVKNEDGSWFERDVYFYDNPVAYLKEADGQNRYRNMRFTGSLAYSFTDDLTLQGLYTRKGNSNIRGYYETKNHVSTTKNGLEGYASRGTDDYVGNYGQITLDYKKNFDLHKITALAGYNYEDNVYEGFYATNRNFPSDAYTYNNIGLGQGLPLGQAGMGSSKSSDKLIAFFGRVTYNYDDKYLLMASLRHEGSSRFGAENKWGSFPGVSAGWRINEESFMENVDWVNNLKLRGGFGVTGINAGSSYQSLSSLNYSNYFFYNGRWIRELIPARNANPDLRWEKKEEFNIGLDFDLFGGVLSGALDYYDRHTKDALYNYDVPTPPYLYGSITANVAEVSNSGFEALLTVNPFQKGDFNWNSVFTYSTNTNKLVSLSNDQFQTTNDFFYAGYTGEPIQIATHIVEVGETIGNFYGLKTVDITEDGIWLVENADGEIIPATESSTADRQILGNGLPKHYLSWNNTFNYKNWDLNVNMRGAFGFQILNFSRMFYENPTIGYNVLDSAFDEVYGKAVLSDVQRFVSHYVEDGDYWKIDNVTLGYTFNTEKSDVINRLRVFASGLNLLTITGYKGVDPEVNRDGLAPGNDDRDKYPTTRTLSLGVNLTF